MSPLAKRVAVAAVLVPVVVAEVDLVSDLAGFWTFDSGSGCAALDASARDPEHYRPHSAWMAQLDKVSEGTQTTLGAYARPWQ